MDIKSSYIKSNSLSLEARGLYLVLKRKKLFDTTPNRLCRQYSERITTVNRAIRELINQGYLIPANPAPKDIPYLNYKGQHYSLVDTKIPPTVIQDNIK